MKPTKYNKIEKALVDFYLEKISMGDTQTNIEVAYWNYEWFIRRHNKHDSRLHGLIKSIHIWEMKRY